jgi:general secretion pathway protein D
MIGSLLFPRILAVALLMLVVGCEKPPTPALEALPTSVANPAAAIRANGNVGAPAPPPPLVAYAPPSRTPTSGLTAEAPAGPFTLDFADTDIREVVAQVLGEMMHVSYTIDPAVHGNVTLHTGRSLSGQQLLPTLQNLLASVGAVLVPNGGLYAVLPASAAGAAGSLIIPLNFVSAEDLAKVLQPLAGNNAKVAPEPGVNALLISGDPAQVQAIRDLVHSFDTDELANQSYALLPVTTGGAKDFADAMQDVFRGKNGGGLAALVRVVPLTRLNAVLIVSSQPRYIDAARQVFALVDRQRRNTVRGWNVFYLQASDADDIAYTLQMAFTPNNVTAVPQSQKNGPGSSRANNLSTGGLLSGQGGLGGGGGGMGGGGQSGGMAGGALGGGALGGGALGGGGLGGGAIGSGGGSNGNAGGATAASATGNPLLGGLDQTGGNAENNDSMRILPNSQNNAILIFGTSQEIEEVIGMLRKIDIQPMQVQIDATIAEVTLNDQLQYGTQFFFKAGGINGILNNASGTLTSLSNVALGTTFPGFVISGGGQGGAPLAISALQSVTTVNVLSSPQLTVVDNQTARLQVGQLVPYLQAQSTSTLTSNPQIVNSIGYQPTGVILEVTPRVNSGGQVTLDISQEVSSVANDITTNGLTSPTFQERNVTSRVVVQDGQTVGLAGLIQDNISHGNQGIPWLKDIPILGALAGTQNNSRMRTELLVLITPHVIRDQSQMRRLAEDMRDALSTAAVLPTMSANEKASGSSDPNQQFREKTRRWLDHQTGR